MRRQAILFPAAAVLALGLFAADGAEAADCPVQLGAILPLSGPNAPIGRWIADTGQLAVDHFNEAGGVLGCEVRYILRDTQGQPAVGVDAAKQLVEVEGVPALIGAVSSAVTMPVLTSVAVPNRVVQVSCCSSAPSFTELAMEGGTEGYFFRTLPTTKTQSYTVARLARDAGYERTAVIHINTDYGTSLAKDFVIAYEALGGSVTDVVAYNEQQASYRAEVSSAMRGEPDSLFLIAFPADGATALREWLAFGGTQNLLLSNAMRSDEFIADVGAQYLGDVIGIDNAQVEDPSVAEFNRLFEERFNDTPNRPGTHLVYDAVAVTLLAAEQAGEATGTAIRDNIREITRDDGEVVHPGVEGFRKAKELIAQGEPIRYVGATGPLQFDQWGDVSGPVLVWGVDDGKLAERRVVTVEEVQRLFREIDG